MRGTVSEFSHLCQATLQIRMLQHQTLYLFPPSAELWMSWTDLSFPSGASWLRTWKLSHSPGWQLCRWDTASNWGHILHKLPGGHREQTQQTHLCPCTLCTSSPLAGGGAVLLCSAEAHLYQKRKKKKTKAQTVSVVTAPECQLWQLRKSHCNLPIVLFRDCEDGKSTSQASSI